MSDFNVPPDYTANPQQMPRPFVRFVLRATEKRDEHGRSSFIDEPWVQVTAMGGKDTLEKLAKDWIENLEAHAHAERIPPEWPRQYREALRLWQEGQEIPANGTPIRTWSALTPGQVEAITRARILTVEDLSLANEDALSQIGMGAVGLRDMARKWVDEAKGPGAMARELSALKLQTAEMKTLVDKLSADNKALTEAMKAQLVAPAAARPTSLVRPKLGAAIELPED